MWLKRNYLSYPDNLTITFNIDRKNVKKCKSNRLDESFLSKQFFSLSTASDVKLSLKHTLCAFISNRLFSKSYFNLNSFQNIRGRDLFANVFFLGFFFYLFQKIFLLYQCIIYFHYINIW